MKSKSPLSRHNPIGYIFVAPWLLHLLLFIILPIGASLYLSFTQYDLLSQPKWVGLDNYVRMFFEDNNYWLAVKYTIFFVVASVPLRLLSALVVATLLSSNHRFIGIYRSLLYVPSIIAGSVAVAVMWIYLFGYDGVINSLALQLGFEKPVPWLTHPKIAIWALIGLGMWQFGSSMLIFLAGIKNIPESYHEAAIMDGARWLKRYFYITLPMLTPVMLFNLVMQTIGAFMTFTQSLLITNGGPLRTTTFYNLYVYRRAFNYFDMGYSSAMAWVLLIIIAVITALIFKSTQYWVYYESEDSTS